MCRSQVSVVHKASNFASSVKHDIHEPLLEGSRGLLENCVAAGFEAGRDEGASAQARPVRGEAPGRGSVSRVQIPAAVQPSWRWQSRWQIGINGDY
jgi:hypothetical protein